LGRGGKKGEKREIPTSRKRNTFSLPVKRRKGTSLAQDEEEENGPLFFILGEMTISLFFSPGKREASSRNLEVVGRGEKVLSILKEIPASFEKFFLLGKRKAS